MHDEQLANNQDKSINVEKSQEIFDRLQNTRSQKLEVTDGVSISFAVGIDPQKELEKTGAMVFVTGADQMPPSIVVKDMNGQKVDLSQLTEPYISKNIRVIEVEGKKYYVSFDAWGLAALFPYLEESEVKDTQPFIKKLQTATDIWEAALQGESQVKSKIEEVFGGEVLETIDKILKILEETPELTEDNSPQLDLMNIAKTAKSETEALSLLDREIQRYTGKHRYLEITDLGKKMSALILKIYRRQPLTSDEHYFAAALSIGKHFLEKSLHQSTINVFAINNLTRKFIMANVAERILARQVMSWELFSDHRQEFEDFNALISTLNGDFDSSELLHPFENKDFVWSFQLPTSTAVANAKGRGYMSIHSDEKKMTSILTHEQLHRLRTKAKEAGIYKRRENMQAGMEISEEFIDEVLTETLSVVMSQRGDLKKSLTKNKDSLMTYKNGVRELLLILEEIEQQTGIPYRGAQLLMKGFSMLRDGVTNQTTQAVELVYDEQIAKRKGAFRERMAQFRDDQMLKALYIPKEEKELPAPELLKIIEQTLEELDWEKLTKEEKKYYFDNINRFKSEVKSINDNLLSSKLKPAKLLTSANSPVGIRILQNVQDNPTANQQLETATAAPYLEVLEGYKEILNRQAA